MPRKLRREHTRKCTACGGKGVSPHFYPPRQCRSCLGTGLVYVSAEERKVSDADYFADLNARLSDMFASEN